MSFLKMKTIQNLSWIQASTFFHKQSIIYIGRDIAKHYHQNIGRGIERRKTGNGECFGEMSQGAPQKTSWRTPS